MGTRTSYPPGTFSWADLGTTDPDAAKAFYGALLGWEADDMPAGDGVTYTMARVGDEYVAGLYRLEQQERPPAWLSYVTVEDADASAARARELGGTAMDPFDVLDSGRMAVVQDPQGAHFAVWQPEEHIGAGRVNDPGCMTWNDLATPDVPGAARFYSELFGWRVEEIAESGGQYWTVYNGERANGGMRPLEPGAPVPYWTVFFTVADLDATLAEAARRGGRALTEPMSVGPGRFVALMDPQGAVFSVYEGDVDD
jgi:uncharacterized protein